VSEMKTLSFAKFRMTAIVSALAIIIAGSSSTKAQTDLRIENCVEAAVDAAKDAYVKKFTAGTGNLDPSGDGLYARNRAAKHGRDPETGLIKVKRFGPWSILVGFALNQSGPLIPQGTNTIVWHLEMNSRFKCSFRPLKWWDTVVLAEGADIEDLSDFREFGQYKF
jgi:hypothetical protein